MPLFEITSLSQFKITYFIEARTAEDAMDEHTMNADIVEARQEHLGEHIMDVRKSNPKKFQKWLLSEAADPDCHSSHWMGDKLINVVDYEETPAYHSAAMDKMSQSLQEGTPETEDPFNESFDDGGPYYG